MKDVLDTSTRDVLASKAFADSFSSADQAMLDARDWTLEYLVKEVRSVVNELIEKVEESDVVRRYNLALRLNALTTVHLTKILEADARGEFDNKPVEDFHEIPS